MTLYVIAVLNFDKDTKIVEKTYNLWERILMKNEKNFPVCGMIMLLGVTYYIIGGILISFLIFKCSFLFYM